MTSNVSGERSAFLQVLGLHITEALPDRVEGWFDAGSAHHQSGGVVHGGAYAAVIEEVAGIGATSAVADRGEMAVGVSNNSDFLRPHRSGRLLISAEPIVQGRSQQLWLVVLRRAEDDKEVARGQVRLHNVSDPRAA